MSEAPQEAGSSASQTTPNPAQPARKTYKQVSVPTREEQIQEDSMNNCAVRTVLSGGMGMVLGVVFGIFMGTMDGAVRSFMLLLDPCNSGHACM